MEGRPEQPKDDADWGATEKTKEIKEKHFWVQCQLLMEKCEHVGSRNGGIVRVR